MKKVYMMHFKKLENLKVHRKVCQQMNMIQIEICRNRNQIINLEDNIKGELMHLYLNVENYYI